MIEVVPFHPDHVHQIIANDANAISLTTQTPAFLATLPKIGVALTARTQERILLLGGIAKIGPAHGCLWAVLAGDLQRHMLWLHRATLRTMALESWRRLEASTPAHFPQGCRWLELLGFQSEGLMRKYGPDGSDHIRYAKV